MKLSLITSLLALTLVGCAGTFGSSPKPLPPAQPERVEVEPPKPANVDIDRAKWKMTLPTGWIVKPGTKTQGQVTQELVARSPGMVGGGPMVVAVNTVALEADDPSDDEFGIATVGIASHATNSEVIAAVPVKVDGHPATMMMLAFKSGLLAIQVATGKDRTGFVVRCGGDIQQGDKIIELCQPIMASFHLK